MNEHTRKILHSSSRYDWGTPKSLYNQLNEIYQFTLDPAANALNAKCAKFYTPEQDGLKQSWANERVFLNPPYGEPEHPCKKNKKGEFTCEKKICIKRGYHLEKYKPGTIDWVRKSYEEVQKRTLIVALLPSRTDTKWFHQYVWDREKGEPRQGVKVDFLQGRLKFEGAKDAAPFPSIIVIWEFSENN